MRFSNWQAKLGDFIATVREKPFTWGAHDCALFACNCILAITGQDPAIDFRGKYDSKETAYQALKDYAGGGLVETIEKITTDLKMPEVPIAFAQRGDVILLDQDGQTMGIVDLSGTKIMIAAEEGLLFHPIAMAQRAWRVD